MTQPILIVEDEEKLAKLLRDYLEQSGFSTVIVSDGDGVLAAVQAEAPQLILLDLMLPNKDGMSICRELRQQAAFQLLPIIMTTARVDEIDRLLGLEMGADDYICKPYSPREVVARVKAVLRRQVYPHALAEAGLRLDHDKMKAYLNQHNLGLTAVEYALLRLMAEAPGRVYSRAQLMASMYQDYRVVSERTIDSHIKKLRQKVATVDPDLELIHSVYGVGYKVECSDF